VCGCPPFSIICRGPFLGQLFVKVGGRVTHVPSLSWAAAFRKPGGGVWPGRRLCAMVRVRGLLRLCPALPCGIRGGLKVGKQASQVVAWKAHAWVLCLESCAHGAANVLHGHGSSKKAYEKFPKTYMSNNNGQLHRYVNIMIVCISLNMPAHRYGYISSS